MLGVNNEHGVRLLSVLGGMGEVFGLAAYRGTAGASFLLRLLLEETHPESPEALFRQDVLLLDFVPRQELRKEDGPILKAVGYKPAPSQPRRFPQFYKGGLVQPRPGPGFCYDRPESEAARDEFSATAQPRPPIVGVVFQGLTTKRHCLDQPGSFAKFLHASSQFSSVVEQLICNERVGGSNPSIGSILYPS